jgi:hypothetical protein
MGRLTACVGSSSTTIIVASSASLCWLGRPAVTTSSSPSSMLRADGLDIWRLNAAL